MEDSTQQRAWGDAGHFPVWDGKRWWTKREVIDDVLRSVPQASF